MSVGAEAVLTRQIDYRPASPELGEGLRLGPNRPATEAAREALKAAVRPAYDALVGFTKKVAGLWSRLAQADRQQAEIRRRATMLSEAEQQAGRSPAPNFAAIAVGRELPARPEAFPEAFALAAGTDPKKLRERLAKMPNLELRQRHRATADGALLCDEEPAMRQDFERGTAVLEPTARRRGFDLETGRHNSAKAVDSAEARRHVDQLAGPLRVAGAARGRQRVRS